MEKEKIIENGQGVIYHELGHLYAYRLASKNPKTNLGEVKSFKTGVLTNYVLPEKTYYHFENAFKSRAEILENTSNIERTLAWFIEVIAGCTFQCCFEEKPFKYCFGNQNGKIGQIDFNNLSVIRNLSSFEWEFKNIFDIQKEFEDIIKEYQIVSDLKKIVTDLKELLFNSSETQIILENKELKKLVNKMDKLIINDVNIKYQELIKKYKKIFDNKASR